MIHLLAFSLPLIVFFCWQIVGYSALSIIRSQRNILQNILLSPAIGFAIILLPIFLLNRIGLPVNSFAPIFTVSIITLSFVTLWWKKPLFPFHRYVPFAAILMLSLILIGWPLLKFGFDWLSFGNDDMANYCLGALRSLHFGYDEIPNFNDLLNGKNYSLYFWFTHSLDLERNGSELLLAWLSALTHLNPLQIFMPLCLALNLTLISTVGGFIYQTHVHRKYALLVCILLTFSALTSLGVLYQLIAQIGGLALLIATCTILFQPFMRHQKNIALRQGILLTIVGSVLLIYYLELLPLLALSFLIYFAIGLIKGWKPNVSFWLTLLFGFIFTSLILNSYCLNVFEFLLIQVQKGLSAFKNELFPFFLAPSGLSYLWGIQFISEIANEPWQSLSILLGIGLYSFILFALPRQIARWHPAAIITLVIILLSFYLFKLNSGFSLFKLAMYAQPFILSVFVMALFSENRFRVLSIFLSIVVVVLGFRVQQEYVKFSLGKPGPFVELTNASRFHFVSELKNLSNQINKPSNILIDSPHVVTEKLIALNLSGNTLLFYSKPNYFLKHIRHIIKFSIHPDLEFLLSSRYKAAENLKPRINQSIIEDNFNFKDIQNRNVSTIFGRSNLPIPQNTYLLASSPKREIINQRKFSKDSNKNFSLIPIKEVANHLIFINSTLGQHYYEYEGEPQHVSLFATEKDYFYKNKTMTGIGRYLLFQAINPSPQVRLELAMTSSLNYDKSNLLPPVNVIGQNHVTLPMIGRGSARVFSPLINLRDIDNDKYLMIDMGKDGKPFPQRQTGLMKLYGKDISFDHRYLIGFARDISLISEKEYQELNPPKFLKNFPEDLANPDLEYSGIYEDGWISEDSFFKLMQPGPAKLTVKGYIPIVNKPITSLLTIYLDGKKLVQKMIMAGEFNFQIDVPPKKGRSKVELHFSKIQFLSNGDPRPVAAKIDSLGFQNS